tara:strand:+ start:5221 stop:6186 length:966 start_codon:yes stop_codon:yes gene_type:complete
MQLRHFHLLFIIFAVLLLCSFLGGANCYKEGYEDIDVDVEETTNTDDEEVKVVMINKNGEITARIVEDGSSENYSTNKGSVNYYYGPNGEKVVAVTGPEGQKMLVETEEGYNIANTYTNTGTNGETTVYYNQPYGNKVVVTEEGSKLVTGPYGNKVVIKDADNTPLIDEDKYILKSQIVPPVCPACPGIKPASVTNAEEKICPQSYPVPLNNEITNTVKKQVQKRQELRDDIISGADPEEIREDIKDIARGRQEIRDTALGRQEIRDTALGRQGINNNLINQRVEARNNLIDQSKTYQVPVFNNSVRMDPKPVLSDFSKFS